MDQAIVAEAAPSRWRRCSAPIINRVVHSWALSCAQTHASTQSQDDGPCDCVHVEATVDDAIDHLEAAGAVPFARRWFCGSVLLDGCSGWRAVEEAVQPCEWWN
jgi:hypothetical protein